MALFGVDNLWALWNEEHNTPLQLSSLSFAYYHL